MFCFRQMGKEAEPLREPRQDRSRKTMLRLLEVTETLLQERPFEAISVQQIVRRAGTSVGAFYSRFRDKQALLPSLYERYDQSIGIHMRELQEQRIWQGRELSEIATLLVQQLVNFFAKRLYLLRALTLYARTRPEEIGVEMRARRQSQHSFLHEAFLNRRNEINHPDPERAVELALYFAASVCRDRILFADAPHSAATKISETELVQEVSRMLLGYLTHSTPPPSRDQ